MARKRYLCGLGLILLGLMPWGNVTEGEGEVGQTAIALELPGWPVATSAGSVPSPPILIDPQGRRFLVHYQWRQPTPLGRGPGGQLRPGWPPSIQFLSFRAPAVLLNDEGQAFRVYSTMDISAMGRVIAVDAAGRIPAGWPAPEVTARYRAPPSLGDLDGDGVAEILAADDVGGLYVLREDGKLFPGWPQVLPDLALPQGKPIFAPPAAADLDGDGLPEFVVAGQQGSVAVYDRFGRLRPGWPRDTSRSNRTPAEFAIVPLGDGTRGVAIAMEGPGPGLILYGPGGEVLPGWPQSLPLGAVGGVAAGDLDGDGAPELFVEDGEVLSAFFLDGSPLPGWPVPVSGFSGQRQPSVVDINGDGLPDVAHLRASSGLWTILAWEADGTPITDLRLGATGERADQSPTFGDLDGDGRLDMTLAIEDPSDIRSPGKVHAFTLRVPLKKAAMQWPTPAHDLQRTSTWEPPTRHLGGRGRAVPGELVMDRPAPSLTLFLDVPEEAPVASGLAVTALGGVSIPPIPVQLVGPGRLSGPGLEGRRQGSGAGRGIGHGRRGRQALPGPGGRLSLPDDPARRKPPAFTAQVDGQAILDAFGLIHKAHPELLLTDDEIRTWLATGVAPTVPDGRTRTLWLTLETPRVGILKLTAHLPLGLRAGPVVPRPHR